MDTERTTEQDVLCGNGCGHDHNSPNGPSGCCTRNPDHGPYLYFCKPCHDEWAAANPEKVKQIQRLARRAHRTPPGSGSTEEGGRRG